MAYNYLRALRKLEYAENCLKKKSIIGYLIYRYRIIRFGRLSYKYNITLHPNTIGYGLYLPHIIGGGTSSTPKNIHTVDWDGNAYYAGTITCKSIVTEGGSSSGDISELIEYGNDITD